MQEHRVDELTKRSTVELELEQAQKTIEQMLKASRRIDKIISDMNADDKILVLTEEEEQMIRAFRRFRLRMRSSNESFRWRTPKSEGVEIVGENSRDPASPRRRVRPAPTLSAKERR